MGINKFFLAAVLSLLCASSIFSREIKDSDLEAIQNYAGKATSYRNVRSLAGLEDNISVGGSAKVAWIHSIEKDHDGARISGSGKNLPNDQAVLDMNLYLDGRYDRTGFGVNVRFRNYGGLARETSGDCKYKDGSGTDSKFYLRRAYIFYKLIEEENRLLEFAAGRRLLCDLFTSEFQFASRGDGVFVSWKDLIEGVASYYLNFAVLVVNTQNHHFAYAFEAGLEDIAEIGLYLRYSFINWRKRTTGDCSWKDGITTDIPRYRFTNSQLSFGYVLDPELLGVHIEAFGGYLHNYAARRIGKEHKRHNYGGYVGGIVGKLKEKNDWRVKFVYQYLGKKAVPHFDVNGAGNSIGIGLHSDTFDPTKKNRAGFKGFRIEAGYCITDDLRFGLAYRQVKANRVATEISGAEPRETEIHKDARKDIEASVSMSF